MPFFFISKPHGEWGNWLKNEVEFSHRTATRFMKVAKEFSNWTSMSNLGTGKLFSLLDVPLEERQDFISQPHEVNGENKIVEEI